MATSSEAEAASFRCFRDQAKTGRVTVTDRSMTRFWLTLEQGVKFVVRSIEAMHGGEVFIPKIPSMNIMDLVTALAPQCDVVNTGIRPGEKLHEVAHLRGRGPLGGLRPTACHHQTRTPLVARRQLDVGPPGRRWVQLRQQHQPRQSERRGPAQDPDETAA